MTEAKLYQLIGNDSLEPMLKFADYGEFKKENKSISPPYLQYFTFETKRQSKKKIKENALETFSKDCPILGDAGNMDVINKRAEDIQNQLNSAKFLNWYNPFKKGYWKNNKEKLPSRIMAQSVGYTGISLGLSIIEKVGPEGIIMSIIGLSVLGTSDISRRSVKKTLSYKLGEINFLKGDYNNFKSNLENSEIVIMKPSEEVKEFYKDVKKFSERRGNGFIDINKINSYLIEAYKSADKIARTPRDPGDHDTI